MWHIFHKWGVVGTKRMVRLDGEGLLPPSSPYTLILYQCTNSKCIEIKTREIDGHWPMEELAD